MNKVLINSLPKSGTHLLGEALKIIGYKKVGHLGSNTFGKTLWGEMRARLSSEHFLVGIDMPKEAPKVLVYKKLGRLAAGQFLTAHIGYRQDLLEQILSHDIKPILIIRDPRAVLSSFVHYVLKEEKHPLNSFFKGMPREECYNHSLLGGSFDSIKLAPLRARCLALNPWLNSERILKVKFEEIVGEKGGGDDHTQFLKLKQISKFIGSESTDMGYLQTNLFGKKTTTFRKGQIASWVEDFPEDMKSLANTELEDILQNWGYSQ